MTAKRIAFLQELLDFIGLEERLHLAWISSAEARRFAEVVTRFTEKVRALGPSPLRGGEWVLPVQPPAPDREAVERRVCGS